ncbi:MAG: CCA tRNA nucleotidyltransferase [Chlamydiia bacterium]|nr:CCA tRNA nucleotidyltransferase [Chlamydiia bacterium]
MPYSTGYSIVKKLYEKGFTAYFAGGWVRDFLMDHPSDDIDIATDASVEDIQSIFPKTIPVGVNFGIVIVVEEGHQFEVATFRKDQGYKDGRRPIGVERADPEEDAKRRDFTINGMFYDPLNEKLYDFVKGQEDLKQKIVRAIGNPHERFLEDRLRMIRAVRYASRFHFSIENETLKAILDHAEALFPAVAIERVWNEFSKMSAFPNFDVALVTLHRLNLLPVIFPMLKEIPIEEIQRRVHILPSFPEDTPVIAKVLELFPSMTLEEKKDLCLYLKLSNHDRDFVSFYHHAQEILDLEKDRARSPFDWAHFYAHPFYPLSLKILATHLPLEERQTFLQKHHMQANALKIPIQNIQNKIPFITSEDLRKEGIPNGKQMGTLLKEGERLAINESLDAPEKIIKRLKKSQWWPL